MVTLQAAGNCTRRELNRQSKAMTNESEVTKRIGESVRMRRKINKLTQRALAEMAECNGKFIERLENSHGKANPSVFALLRIAEALGCSISDLCGDGNRLKHLSEKHETICQLASRLNNEDLDLLLLIAKALALKNLT